MNILDYLGQVLQRFLVGTVQVDIEAERLYRRMATWLFALVIAMLLGGLAFNITGARWINILLGLVFTGVILVQSFYPRGLLAVVLGTHYGAGGGSWTAIAEKYLQVVMTVAWVGQLYFLYMATISFVENPFAFFGILLVLLVVFTGAFIRKLPSKKFWTDLFTVHYPIAAAVWLGLSLIPISTWVNWGIPARTFAERPQDALIARIEKIDEENQNDRMTDSLRMVYKKIRGGALLSELTPREQQLYREGATDRDMNSTPAQISGGFDRLFSDRSAGSTQAPKSAMTIAITYQPGTDPLNLAYFVIPDDVPNGRYLVRVSGSLTFIENLGQRFEIPLSGGGTFDGRPFPDIGLFGMVFDAESGLRTNMIEVTDANRRIPRKVELNLPIGHKNMIIKEEWGVKLPKKILVELVPQ